MRSCRSRSRLMWFALAACLTPACVSAPARAYRHGVDAWERAASPSAEQPPEITTEATLDDLLRHAAWVNPGLRAAAQRWRAALERVPAADALPDPRLDFGYFLDEVETRTGPMQWRLGLRQPFPWPGTLDAAARAELAAAEAAAAEFEAARLAVAEELRRAWFELAYVYAALDVTRAHLDLLTRWEEVARTRYATGLGSDADLIRAQVELGKVSDRARSLDDLRRPLAAQLNALLDRPAGAPLPAPTLRAAELAPLIDDAVLLAELPHTSPELLALERRVKAAEHGLDLADARGWPEFSLGVDYTSIGSARAPGVSGSGDDAVALTAGVSLPIWRSRRDADTRRADALLGAARAAHRDALNRQTAELELALFEWRDAERRRALYEDNLVPKGRESVQTTLVAYQADTLGFLELIDAERVLLEFQLAAARARADRAQALARVERLSGAPTHTEAAP